MIGRWARDKQRERALESRWLERATSLVVAGADDGQRVFAALDANPALRVVASETGAAAEAFQEQLEKRGLSRDARLILVPAAVGSGAVPLHGLLEPLRGRSLILFNARRARREALEESLGALRGRPVALAVHGLEADREARRDLADSLERQGFEVESGRERRQSTVLAVSRGWRRPLSGRSTPSRSRPVPSLSGATG